MPHSFSRIITHLIFSTKFRYPYLRDDAIRNEMHAYLGGSCNMQGCPCIIVGGAADHIHMFFLLSRNISIARFTGEIKRSSSGWIKTKGIYLEKFSWQSGYGAFSVGQSEVDGVRTYITTQMEHHQKQTFQEEYLAILNELGIPYDERYLWD